MFTISFRRDKSLRCRAFRPLTPNPSPARARGQSGRHVPLSCQGRWRYESPSPLQGEGWDEVERGDETSVSPLTRRLYSEGIYPVVPFIRATVRGRIRKPARPMPPPRFPGTSPTAFRRPARCSGSRRPHRQVGLRSSPHVRGDGAGGALAVGGRGVLDAALHLTAKFARHVADAMAAPAARLVTFVRAERMVGSSHAAGRRSPDAAYGLPLRRILLQMACSLRTLSASAMRVGMNPNGRPRKS